MSGAARATLTIVSKVKPKPNHDMNTPTANLAQSNRAVAPAPRASNPNASGPALASVSPPAAVRHVFQLGLDVDLRCLVTAIQPELRNGFSNFVVFGRRVARCSALEVVPRGILR